MNVTIDFNKDVLATAIADIVDEEKQRPCEIHERRRRKERMTKKSTSKKRPVVARKVKPVVRLGIADFKCNACGKIYQRDLGWKVWTPSFCEATGRNARLYRVSSPSKPNTTIQGRADCGPYPASGCCASESDTVGGTDIKYPMIRLMQGDCLELMKDIPDKSIDAIICDLPYGTTQNRCDITLPFDKLWEHYERIIKDNGAIVLFGQGLFFVDLINSNRKLFRYDLVWDKQLISGFLNANRMPLRVHENIAVFYKKLPTYNPQYTDGKPLHSKGKSYLNKEHKNENYGKFEMTDDSRAGSTQKHPKSIISFQKPHPSKAQHRTEKSIEMLEWLIKTYTNEGEVVLDNTMGSGTTGVACVNTNRGFIGIEKDPVYFEVARKRLEDEMAQGTFDFSGGAVAPTHNPGADRMANEKGEKE